MRTRRILVLGATLLAVLATSACHRHFWRHHHHHRGHWFHGEAPGQGPVLTGLGHEVRRI